MEEQSKGIFVILGKFGVWIALILLGIIAKFSYDVSIKKKFTFVTVLSTIGIAIFVGYLAAALCVYKKWEKEGMMLVPVATIASEKIVAFIIANAHKWLAKWLKPPKDDEK